MAMPGFSSFDDEDFEKAPSKEGSGLPDGKYECEITSVDDRDTTAGEVFSYKFVVIRHDNPKFINKKLERAIFLEPQNGTEAEREAAKERAIGDLKRDMNKLGFDVDNWKKANGRPFKQQMEIAMEMMRGMHVVVTQKASANSGK